MATTALLTVLLLLLSRLHIVESNVEIGIAAETNCHYGWRSSWRKSHRHDIGECVDLSDLY